VWIEAFLLTVAGAALALLKSAIKVERKNNAPASRFIPPHQRQDTCDARSVSNRLRRA